MDQFVTGTVCGNSIVFESPLGMADGQMVAVRVRPVASQPVWGTGIQRSAGGWASDPAIGATMDQIYVERKLERRESISP